ncbi:hypothetical protein TcBrA4_0129940 [Trypanosoma cruzi]|nr:hypothetical protein TcBrA4_0129940 [Trypanosoma cruzi]
MQSFRANKRDVENVLHDFSTFLRQFQGSNGLRCFLDQGKLSLLSAMGEFKQSSDEIYDRRMKVLSQTRVSLMKLSDHFDAVGNAIETLFAQLDGLLSELHNFKEICENHLEMATETFSEQAEFISINSLKVKLRALSQELTSSIRTNCCGIQSSSIEQLDKAYLDVKCEVSRTQTAFDVWRRDAEVCESKLLKSRSGSSHDQVRELEFKLRRLLERLHESGDKYHEALQGSMNKTSFLLEQVSMATWAACNVFFLHLSVFFKDAMNGFELVASALSSVKNNRSVSRRINLEKQAAAAAAATVATASSLCTTTVLPRLVEEKTAPSTSPTHELEYLFSAQLGEGSVSHINLTEDEINRGTREFTDIDDIFK